MQDDGWKLQRIQFNAITKHKNKKKWIAYWIVGKQTEQKKKNIKKKKK